MLVVGVVGLRGDVNAGWAALTAVVAAIAITNPDSVEGFETGTIDLAAGEVATWLGARSPDESDLARMYRVGLFWEAWLGEVRAAEDPSVVPGEIDSGIGRFVRGIAGGEADVASLPVTEEQMADGGVRSEEK